MVAITIWLWLWCVPVFVAFTIIALISLPHCSTRLMTIGYHYACVIGVGAGPAGPVLAGLLLRRFNEIHRRIFKNCTHTKTRAYYSQTTSSVLPTPLHVVIHTQRNTLHHSIYWMNYIPVSFSFSLLPSDFVMQMQVLPFHVSTRQMGWIRERVNYAILDHATYVLDYTVISRK